MGIIKKLGLLALVLCLAAGSAVCARGENAREFTDSAHRVVAVPTEITRVAVSGSLAQNMVFAIAPDVMVCLAEGWFDGAEAFLEDQYLALPVIGQLYGSRDALNLESLLAADPQIVIDVGQPKDTLAQDMDALSEQTGIPFVHIDCALDAMDETFEALGALLNRPAAGLALGKYCADAYGRATDAARRAEKANLLYITGSKGLNVIARGSYHAQVIDLMANNLAVLEAPSSKGIGNEVDMEQILLWNPDVILFAPDSIDAAVAEDPAWQSVSAIQSGAYYRTPATPGNWLGFPPAAQQLLGMLWMGKLLYPGEADYDLYEEAAKYMDLFCHGKLTRDQYDQIVGDSLGRLN